MFRNSEDLDSRISCHDMEMQAEADKATAETENKSWKKTCTDTIKRKLPIVGWLPTYQPSWIWQDSLAGFTVALTEIPQGIAYAIASPSQYGLYSGFTGGYVYALLGTLKCITIGPTAIMALMIRPHVTTMGEAGGILITFLSGCVIFALGLLHLGFIVDFFSYPVIAGFTTAAALNIASSQLRGLLGITGSSDAFLDTIISVLQDISQTSKWDALLGLFSIIFLALSKEMRVYGTLMSRKDWSRTRNNVGRFIFIFSLASNALAVMAGAIIAYFTFVDMVKDYGTVIAFCPLVAILEHQGGKTLDASQELIALGVTNILGSFFHSMPVTGSFTRTAVNDASGVRTTANGIVMGTVVLLALGLLTTSFQYIPKASLAAVVMVSMYYLCDFAAFTFLWRTKKTDLIPLSVTMLACLTLGLEYGILIGVGTNAVFLLYATARPKFDVARQEADTYVVTPKTGIYFSAAEYLREYVLTKCVGEKTTVIIDGKYVGNIDATVAKSLNVLREELELRDQYLVLLNFKKSVRNICVGANKKMGGCFPNENSE
ncbi:hypothetical protein NQ318_022495 [Aromia moschata]|uniref:STAS domain-containing protein n=1 Tax=Aromia moschata TaxID=1265417 RepID=A0AAV8Z6R8_9CUCU|nr:hypothetical protein NQ318_022495 [Aromia moschata]